MSQFTKTRVVITEKDKPARVSKLAELIANTIFETEIRKGLSVSDYEKDYVVINGARTLFDSLLSLKDKYLKIDVASPFRNVTLTPIVKSDSANNSIFHLSFDDSETAKILYTNEKDATDEEKKAIADEIADENFFAQPIYDAQTQLFQALFELDKHANTLIERNAYPDNELIKLLDAHLQRIKEYFSSPKRSFDRRYRLLRQVSDGKYFFRALVSRKVYKDYDLGVSVFVALLGMHQVMKDKEGSYLIREFIFNESELDVFFEDTFGKKITGVGEARFEIHLTNSELGNGAVKMMGLFSILVDIDGKKVPLKMRRPDGNEAYSDTIITISHGTSPEKAIEAMAVGKTITAVKNQIFKDLERISTARKAETLRDTFVSRLDNSRSLIPNDAKRAELNKVFNEQVKNFEDLLKIMGKSQLIIEDEGIEVKDSLRNLVYNIVMGPNNNSNNDGKRPRK